MAPCKGFQDSLGFWIPRRGFRILGTGFQSLSMESGFWIPIVSGIPDSLSCILDSKAQDSTFPYMRRWRMFFWCRNRIQILVKFSSKIDLGNNFSYLCKFSRHQKIHSCKYRCKIHHCWCKLHWRHREVQKKYIRRYLNNKIKGWMSSTLRASSPIAGRLKLCVSMLTGQDGKLLSSDSSLDVCEKTWVVPASYPGQFALSE